MFPVDIDWKLYKIVESYLLMLLYLDSSLMDVFDLIGIFLHSYFSFFFFWSGLEFLIELWFLWIKRINLSFCNLNSDPVSIGLEAMLRLWNTNILHVFNFQAKNHVLKSPHISCYYSCNNQYAQDLHICFIVDICTSPPFLLIMNWNLSRFPPSSF